MTLANIGPLVTFIGLFIAAYFASKSEIRKFRKDRITQAYTNFLDALAQGAGPRSTMIMVKMARGEKLDDAEMAIYEQNNARHVNAHSNLVIHGSKEVIGALSDFYNTSGDFRDPVSRDAYIALVHAMRHDSEAEDYAAFGSHVDNILITGPGRRQAVIRSNPAFQPGHAGSQDPARSTPSGERPVDAIR